MTYITKTIWRKAMFSSRILRLVLVGFVLVVFQASTVQAQWTTTGTNISNSNTGNVGVGTTTSTPSERLSVLVQDAVNNGVNQVLSIGHTTTGTPSAGLGSGLTFRAKRSDGVLASTGYIAGIWEDPTNGTEDGALVFAPLLNSSGYGTERMRITSTGNVGIGTASPGAKLHVNAGGTSAILLGADTEVPTYNVVSLNGSVTDAGHLGLAGGGGTDKTLYVDTPTGGAINFRVNTSSKVIIDTGGNVGIGTSTPTTKLHIVGDLTVTGNIAAKYQDVAEWVQSSQVLPAGTVVVLDQTKSNQVIASTQSYDTRVAGVISSQPGITLGDNGAGKVLVATTGRVRIKVDASRGAIQVGDLLVTSDVAGMAMKSQPLNLGGVQIHRPGTLIGKALEPLAQGTSEILVLLSLQ